MRHRAFIEDHISDCRTYTPPRGACRLLRFQCRRILRWLCRRRSPFGDASRDSACVVLRPAVRRIQPTVRGRCRCFHGLLPWTLASGLWSHAEDRALTEFDRSFLYLMILVLCGLVPRSMWRMRWMTRGIAAGASVVCLAGLITRVLPNVWPEVASLADNRLSYPITYWNALGILASIGTCSWWVSPAIRPSAELDGHLRPQLCRLSPRRFYSRSPVVRSSRLPSDWSCSF